MNLTLDEELKIKNLEKKIQSIEQDSTKMQFQISEELAIFSSMTVKKFESLEERFGLLERRFEAFEAVTLRILLNLSALNEKLENK